jgi:phosphoribosyl 1,2-cyclic phosphodiesterase
MRLKVLGSGSSGNCYILENADEALIIEAGVHFMEAKRSLKFNTRKIVGVIVSHCHADHASFVDDYLKAGIPVLMPYLDDAGLKYTTTFGRFAVGVFPLVHDVPCYGFHIQHPDMGNLVYASDTEYVKYRFKNLNHIMIEANYDIAYMPENLPHREHVIRGHMSIQTVRGFIEANDNPMLKTITLIHLSEEGNSDEKKFIESTKEATKYGCAVRVADSGVEFDL